jgi:RNA polymerase sigma-70 factor, ECF subfamily
VAEHTGSSPVALMQQLHDEHAGPLWGYCLRLTGHDRPRAEDLLQETLLRAWRSSRLLDESRGSVRSWLFTVARNLAIDDWRTKRTRTELTVAEPPEPDLPGQARDHTDQLLLSWVVADALARLSDDHRAVLLCCYYRGMSVADAARTLDIPEGTVKSRSHYALRALRLALEEMGVSA